MQQRQYRTFGEWIRYRLDVTGMTQGQLSRALGIDRGYLSKIVSGTAMKFPPPDRAREFVEALGSTFEDMLLFMGYIDNGHEEASAADRDELVAQMILSARELDIPEPLRETIITIIRYVETEAAKMECHESE